MTHPQLVVRGDWRGFALYLEPANVIVQVFATLTGAARALTLGSVELESQLRAAATERRNRLIAHRSGEKSTMFGDF